MKGIFWLILLLPLAVPADPRGADEVEAFARQYYDGLQALDYPAMRALSMPAIEVLSMSTPEFEILGEGLRIGHTEFERQVAAARKAGRKLEFQLTQHRTTVAGDVAWTSYMFRLMPGEKVGIGEMVLRRVGGRWLLDRLTHMPFYAGYPL